MNAQDLKNSILQLAVQGKLVEQRPEEGTAKEQLEQIKAEKEKLIKEKKIKKEKPLPEVTEEEIPFEIPESWEWMRVGYVGSWSAGATPSRQHPEYYEGEIPWLKTGDLNDGYITDIPEFVGQLALEKTSLRLNPIGSVLMAMYGATIGKLGILKIEATTNQACCACIPYSCIENKYLFFYLMSQRKNYISMGAGGAQPNISKEKIVMSLIPVPPLDEQKRIVAKIEEILPYIDQYDKAYTKLETFNKKFPEDMKKSILQLAMQGKLVEQRPEEGTADELYEQIVAEKAQLIKDGKIKKEKSLPEITEDEIPYEIPSSWKWVRIGSIFVTSSGTTPSKSNSEYYSKSDYNWVRTTDLNNGILELCEIQISQKAFEECRLTIIPRDSVCIAMYGGAGTIGKNSIIKFDTTINQSVCAIHPNGFCDALFLQRFIQYYRPNWMKMAVGSRKDPNINQVIIKNALFPLPPLAEQKRIVAKIEELLPYCDQLVK